MKQKLISYLCDPVDKSTLTLIEPVFNNSGDIVAGKLVSASGREYGIINGIPRFVVSDEEIKEVNSFGDEWNYFNFDAFYEHWLKHTIKNTFGSTDVFKNKIIVDAGGGSGMQTRWMSEAGADYVICLELSHSVDGVMRKNLEGLDNIDIVQCSIDSPPLKEESITGMVICHNVIQHTRSVEKTAAALWGIVAPGAEFVFNCYQKNDKGFFRTMRLNIYYGLRRFLSKKSFRFVLLYAKIMSAFRFIPLLGFVLEKSLFVIRGDVPRGLRHLKRKYIAGVLNTFDCYGSHAYQHLKSDEEIQSIVHNLQPNSNKVFNSERYFSRPMPIGCALRVFK